MKYFDAHCHVQFPVFDGDRAELLARMREAELGGLVVGCDLASSRAAVELVQNEPELWATIGLHPNHALEEEFDEPAFRELLSMPKVVGIGECGLDNYRPEDPAEAKPKQRELFAKHIELALAHDKPLMIHSRPGKGTMDAYHDTADILRSYKQEHGEKLRGDMHFFVGGIEEAKAFIDLGFTLSYTAVLTFARDYDEVVRYAPLESLLTETDAPYVAPKSRRGQRNDPSAIPEVVEAIASIRGQESEKIRAQVLENARRLFLAA